MSFEKSSSSPLPARLVFVVLATAFASMAQALTWSVAPGSPGACTPADPACSTIQGAIDAASPGDTISIGAGTYRENLRLNKALELAGAGEAAVTLQPAVSNPDPAGCGASSLCGGATAASNIILVEASGTSIHDLTLDGDNDQPDPVVSSGVTVGGVDIDARNGIIENFHAGVFDATTVHHVTIRNVFLRALYASSGGNGFDFHHNTITNVRGSGASIAIFAFSASGRIADNVVSGCNDAIAANWSRGIEFLDNTVTGCESGVHTDNSGGTPPDRLARNVVSAGTASSWGVWTFVPYVEPIVEDNVITDVQYGLSTWGQAVAGVGTIFRRNSVDGANRAGSIGFLASTDFSPWGSSDVVATLTSNTIRRNDYGLVFDSTYTSPPDRTVTVSGRFNRITGNSLGGAATAGSQPGPFVLDLANNWWGCNAGPGNAGCDAATGLATTNPRLVLSLDLSSGSAPPGAIVGATASLGRNSDGADLSALGAVLDTTPVLFGATLGSLAPPATGTLAGVASSVYSAPAAGGFDTVAATVDGQTVSAPLTVVPAISSLSPPFAVAGRPAGIPLGVTGLGFDPSCVVRWNGSNRATAFGSATTLSGTLTVADLAAPTTATITVRNGALEDSNGFPFVVYPRPAVVWVNDDWTGTPLGADPDGATGAVRFGHDAFATIQEAVDVVADGGEIRVHAGLYTGTVNVEGRPGLTVRGIAASRDLVILRPASTIPWNVPPYGATRQTCIRVVSSTDVAFRSLTFDFETVRANFLFGLLVWDSTASFDDDLFEDVAISDALSAYHEFVAYVRAPGPPYSAGNRAAVSFTGSLFRETGRVAILTHDFVDATIVGNTFTKSTDDFGYAIELGSESTGTIRDNVFSGFDTPAGDGSASAAIYVENAFTEGSPPLAKPVTVSGNEISGGQYGVWIGNEWSVAGVASGDVDIDVTFADNFVHDNAADAVYVVDANRAAGSSVTVTASGNRLEGNGSAGTGAGYLIATNGTGEVHLSSTSDTLLNNDESFHVEQWAAGASLFDVVFHFGRFVDNPLGAVNLVGTATVDATNSWWGCNAPTVAGGSGCDPIGGLVSFDPWLVLEISAAPATVAPAGAAMVSAQLRRNSAAAVPVGTLPDGVPIAFGGVFGTVSPPLDALVEGLPANPATFVAGGAPGPGAASATLDNQTVEAPITIAAAGCAPGNRVGDMLGVKNGDGTATFTWTPPAPEVCFDHYQVWAQSEAFPLDPAWSRMGRVDFLELDGSLANATFTFDTTAAGSLTCFLAVPAGAGEQPGPNIAPPTPTGP